MATGFRNLTIYKKAFALAMNIYHVRKKFPKDELYSLFTHIRKSLRSVCSNIGEGYRKLLYEANFVSKISVFPGRKIADLKMQSIMKSAIIKP